MHATIVSRGRITVPKPIRDRLGLRAGDHLEFVVRCDGRVEMTPRRGSLTRLKAMVPPPVTGVSLADMEQAVLRRLGDDARA